MIASELINFVTVLAVAVGVACAISVLYASGLRLWAAGDVDAQGTPHLLHRVVSVVCFTAFVLFALWLMIPMFH